MNTVDTTMNRGALAITPSAPATVPADTIRLAGVDDASAVAELITYSYRARAASGEQRRHAQAQADAWLAAQGESIRDGRCYVAEIEGDVLAACAWGPGAGVPRSGTHAGHDETCDRVRAAHLIALAVHPAYAPIALARLLIILCESAAVRRGFDSIDAVTTNSHRWLYLACGFRPVEPTQVRYPGGVTVPCLRARRHLCVGQPLGARRHVPVKKRTCRSFTASL